MVCKPAGHSGIQRSCLLVPAEPVVGVLASVPFFRGMADQPHWLGVKACTQATLGDAGIALAAFWVTAIFSRTRSWILRPNRLHIAIFLGVGVLLTILFEALASGTLDRWAYNDAMPRLPVLGTGLLPLLQWLALPPLVLWFVRRQIGAPASGNGRWRGMEPYICSLAGRRGAASLFLLFGRTRNGAETAEHTAVSGVRAEKRLAVHTFVKEQTCVGRHDLCLLKAAIRTGDHAFQRKRHQRAPLTVAGYPAPQPRRT